MGLGEPSVVPSPQAFVNLGPGFPTLTLGLVDEIRSNEYVKLAELPPAKGVKMDHH